MKKVFVYNVERDAHNYVLALKQINAKYIVSTDITLSRDCSHLLLCGGGDVYPYFYNERLSDCYNLNLTRDLAELYLIRRFSKFNLPILGICRGMQIINVTFGGSLERKIVDHSLHFNNEGDVFHNVENVCGFSRDIYGKCCTVNSAHRQKIKILANEFIPCSYADDLTLESFCSKDSKILGVQFHPERLSRKTFPILEYFLSLS